MKQNPHEVVVSGLLPTQEAARHTVGTLSQAHIPERDIHVIQGKEDYEREHFSRFGWFPLHDEGYSAAKLGIMVGGILGTLAGMVGSMVMGGISWMAAIPFTVFFGVAGSALGFIVNTGFRETDAETLDHAVDQGKILIDVHERDRSLAKVAERVLRQEHAELVHHY